MFNTNWSSYSGNTRFDLGTNITRELQNLYMVGRGNKNKNRWINAEKAYYIILDTVIKYDWFHIMTPSVANIKSLFSKTPVKMQDIIQSASYEINTTAMEQIDTDDTSKQKEDMEEL